VPVLVRLPEPVMVPSNSVLELLEPVVSEPVAESEQDIGCDQTVLAVETALEDVAQASIPAISICLP
jgi:hypothetical protein